MASHPYWSFQEMLSAGEAPDILAIGDSWFWYPFNNLLNPIFNVWNGTKVIFALGANGAESVDYVGAKYQIEIEETLDAYKRKIKLVILSGGGNDIAGLDDFDLIVNDDCSKAKSIQECYELGQPKAILDTIENAYRTLILRIHRLIPSAHVVTHNYDYAIPTGKGFLGMGNWLKAPMDAAHVPLSLQADLVNDLIKKFGLRLRKIAKENSSIHFVKSAGTLKADEWTNELHPKLAGFNKIAKVRWAPVLTKLLP